MHKSLSLVSIDASWLIGRIGLEEGKSLERVWPRKEVRSYVATIQEYSGHH